MLNEKIEVFFKQGHHRGLRAKEIIEEGEFIWEESAQKLTFHELTLDQIEQLDEERRQIFNHYAYQIDRGLFSGPLTQEEIENDPANFMNHSCVPNAWYEGDKIIARKKILPGDEVTYDYATDCFDRDWDFECQCGEEKCRKKITKNDWKFLIPVYKNHFISYLNDQIQQFNPN